MKENFSLKKEDTDRIIKIFQSTITPFERFVAKTDLEEISPLPPDRKEFFIHLVETITANPHYRIFPLSGEIGIGKTYILCKIKTSPLISYPAIFMEIPPTPSLFYYSIYIHIIKQMGTEVLRRITETLYLKWSKGKRKYGFFQMTDTQILIENAKKQDPYQTSSYPEALIECMIAIIEHNKGGEKAYIAERWLLGETMDNDELYYLGLEHNLKHPEVAHEILRLFLNEWKEEEHVPILLMFDDLDKNYDSSYFYEESDEENHKEDHKEAHNIPYPPSLHFLYDLLSLIEEFRSLKIIFTFEIGKEDPLNFFQSKKKEYVAPVHLIPLFTLKDTLHFYKDTITHYLLSHNFTASLPTPYYPLSEKIIKYIHYKSQGIPREIIKKIQKTLDLIVFDEISPEKIEHSPRDFI